MILISDLFSNANKKGVKFIFFNKRKFQKREETKNSKWFNFVNILKIYTCIRICYLYRSIYFLYQTKNV